MEREAADALYAALHEKAPYHDGTFSDWSATRSRKYPFHFSEGIKVGIASTNLMPWDDFTKDANASPFPPSEEPAAEQEGHHDDG